jgi:eukaryotic-like serine/threonine-protein kinase
LTVHSACRLIHDMSVPHAEPWSENWKVIRPLGGGGQGDTLLVESTRGVQRSAVLKCLKQTRLHDLKSRGRMHREVTSLCTLAAADAKVPRYYDGNTGQFEDLSVPLYFVMEHIDGETLDQVIRKSGPLSLETALNLVLDLCATLRIAIQEGITHRDIKPENLVVRSLAPADVVTLDFGLSFNKGSESTFTDTDETLDNKFLSLPERRGPYENKRDFRSDLTSIGGVLFYCITGVAPKNLRDSQGRTPNRSEGVNLSKLVSDPVKLAHLHSFFDRGLNNDIDVRFQTLDAVESRIRHIGSESKSEPEENFADAMKDHVATLYKIDRHNRYARYREELKPIEQAVERLTVELRQQMKGFVVTRHRNLMAPQTVIPQDVIWSYPISCHVGGHDFQRIITYLVEEDGDECILVRTLAFQNPLETPIQKDRVELLRYLPPAIPDIAIVKADINGAVLKAVESLIEGIRAKTQTEHNRIKANKPLPPQEALKALADIRQQLSAEMPQRLSA